MTCIVITELEFPVGVAIDRGLARCNFPVISGHYQNVTLLVCCRKEGRLHLVRAQQLIATSLVSKSWKMESFGFLYITPSANLLVLTAPFDERVDRGFGVSVISECL